MLYVDDACIVIAASTYKNDGNYRPRERRVWLNRFREGDGTMCMPAQHMLPVVIHVEAAGQRYRQSQFYTYLEGVIIECPDISTEIARRSSACWMCIRRYQQDLFDRPNVSHDLKIRMVNAETVETLLYCCVTWTTRHEHFRKLFTVHHRVLLRIFGARRYRLDHRVLSYNRALELTGCESM